MKHKTYVKQIHREKALYKHNKEHRNNIDQECRYCKLFPNAIIVIGIA